MSYFIIKSLTQPQKDCIRSAFRNARARLTRLTITYTEDEINQLDELVEKGAVDPNWREYQKPRFDGEADYLQGIIEQVDSAVWLEHRDKQLILNKDALLYVFNYMQETIQRHIEAGDNQFAKTWERARDKVCSAPRLDKKDIPSKPYYNKETK